ncbi:IS110 family transposase [Streptomyces monomycini]|uniref:IS110 family transposase n=1 Tax=Streptomyces monomycini TaxID=371720 RepID=UPI00067A9F2E|nr:transposase [Streptomyces monomycini]
MLDNAGEVVCDIANRTAPEGAVPDLWAGVDIGKKHHHCVVINADSERCQTRRVLHDEPELLQLVGDAQAVSTDVLRTVDTHHGLAAPLIGLLLHHGQPIAYLAGRTVHRPSATHRSEGKTDARDAFIIADQARIWRDVSLLRRATRPPSTCTCSPPGACLVLDSTRQINRLHAQLLAFFPAPERALDLTKKGPCHAADPVPDAGCSAPHRRPEIPCLAGSDPTALPLRGARPDVDPVRRMPATLWPRPRKASCRPPQKSGFGAGVGGFRFRGFQRFSVVPRLRGHAGRGDMMRHPAGVAIERL